MASSCLYIICIIHVVFWIYPTQGNTGQDELLPTGIGLSSYDSHHVVAQKNGKLLLNCSVDVKSTEYGVPLVSWRKDGQWISLDNRIQKVQNGSLYFKRVWHKKKKGVSDEGVYECVVKNSIGSIIARRVIVQVASIAKDYTSEPVSQEVVEGGVARFECKIRAVPPPLYTWIKDEIQLATSDRYIMMNSGILQILDVRAEDEGHYSCHATSGGLHHLPDTVNSITWKRSTEAYLTVTAGNKPRPASIVAGPSDTDALIGQTVILECLVDGFPKPTVRWRKENGNITRYVLQESNLKLLEVEEKDTGIYVCEVTSRDGPVITAKVRLTVITPPVITEKPKSVEWPRARLTRFLCNAEGFPKPVITWYKNGVDVTLISKKDGRYKVKENGQLVIEQSVKDDSGFYQCIAENSVDFTSAFARLAITTKDTAPGKPNVTARALTSNSIEVRWVSPEFDKRCPIIAYSMKVNERKSGINVDNAVVSATDVSKKFVNLKPFTNYTVYVTGFTTQCGAGEQSDPVTVATLEDVPSKAPLIRLVSTTPNTIMVAWDPLPAEVRNGIIIEYLVFYMKADTTIVMKHTTPGDATSFLIEGLQPDTEYRVRVLASTSAGYSRIDNKDWPWVDYRTPIGIDPVPRPPDMHIIQINATAVNISWHRPSESVPLDGYLLSVSKLDGDQHLKDLDLPADRKYQLLTNLENDSFYTVSLVAKNQHGMSSPATDEFQTSEVPLVAMPTGLKVNQTMATEVYLTWDQPKMVAKVAYYTVRYSGLIEVTEKEVTSTRTSVLIKGLKPFTTYKFEVQVHTMDGRTSSYTGPVQIKTREDVPSPPVNMSALMKNGNIIVSWKPPALPNGQITTYIILYQLWSEAQPRGEWHTIKINGTITSWSLQYYEGRYYYLKMAACNEAGQGNESRTITVPERETVRAPRDGFPDQKTGIIIGCLIGLVCIIICVLIILCRNRCFNTNYPQTQTTRLHGNGHIPNHRNGNAIPPAEQRLLDHHQMALFTSIQPENQNCDSKGCGSGNLIVTPNGSKVNGYVPFKNGVRNGHVPNGRVTSFTGRGDLASAEETHGLIAYMLQSNDGSHTSEEKPDIRGSNHHIRGSNHDVTDIKGSNHEIIDVRGSNHDIRENNHEITDIRESNHDVTDVKGSNHDVTDMGSNHDVTDVRGSNHDVTDINGSNHDIRGSNHDVTDINGSNHDIRGSNHDVTDVKGSNHDEDTVPSTGFTSSTSSPTSGHSHCTGQTSPHNGSIQPQLLTSKNLIPSWRNGHIVTSGGRLSSVLPRENELLCRPLTSGSQLTSSS